MNQTPLVLGVYHISFPTNSVNFRTEYTSESDPVIKNYLQFSYPELQELKYESIIGIPDKVFSCIRTTIEHEYEYVYILRYSTPYPHNIFIVTSQHHSFFIDCLHCIYQSRARVNISLLLSNIKTLTSSSFEQPIINLGNYQIGVKKNKDILATIRMLGVNTFVDIFFKIMLEERYVFVTNSFELLQPTIFAFQYLLTPFVWQQILIPVLPMFLSGYISTIIPCIIGCTNGTYGAYIMDFNEDDVGLHVFDLDKKHETTKSIVPNMLLNQFFGLFLGKLDHLIQNEETTDDNVSNLFLEFFKSMLGHFRYYFDVSKDGGTGFNVEAFLLGTPDTFKEYVKRFTETQMFWMFIEEQQTNFEKKTPFYNFIDAKTETSYLSLLNVSTIERRCGLCLQTIKRNDPIFQYADKSVCHRQCACCSICKRFSDIKKCPLCVDIKQPMTQEEINKKYEQALQGKSLLRSKMDSVWLSEQTSQLLKNNLTEELTSSFHNSMTLSFRKLLDKRTSTNHLKDALLVAGSAASISKEVTKHHMISTTTPPPLPPKPKFKRQLPKTEVSKSCDSLTMPSHILNDDLTIAVKPIRKPLPPKPY
ncbi:hypothetical protein EIN_033640 [Entamoeba invadens IP1]|uniref:UDENN domain-containing protein n=1 Tax=Entamoeba invadens IP1 TaxID=370355 RepID=A0A0A1U1K5_ENTIV|nr:hypothetical protein EIN_033640 [Entamoeba invadens IP1]ELP86483.1 hypothetical protein EIN_033640 [Entamoeba invadens IP1]|eukprot:XP_004185829.1 hypothetical protein EIN_033640 [Entamoeba invadens IP1]